MWGKAIVAAEASEVVRRNERRETGDEDMGEIGVVPLAYAKVRAKRSFPTRKGVSIAVPRRSTKRHVSSVRQRPGAEVFDTIYVETFSDIRTGDAAQ